MNPLQKALDLADALCAELQRLEHADTTLAVAHRIEKARDFGEESRDIISDLYNSAS
jgi:hypothetical protein